GISALSCGLETSTRNLQTPHRLDRTAVPRRSLSRRLGKQDWLAYRHTSGTHDSRTDPLRTELDGIGRRSAEQIPREDCFGLEKTGWALCHTTGRNRFVFIAAACGPSARSRQSHGRKTEAP